MKDLPNDLMPAVDDEGFLNDFGVAFGHVAYEVKEVINKVHHAGWPEAGNPMDIEAVY